jgi:hypothetical protein
MCRGILQWSDKVAPLFHCCFVWWQRRDRVISIVSFLALKMSSTLKMHTWMRRLYIKESVSKYCHVYVWLQTGTELVITERNYK